MKRYLSLASLLLISCSGASGGNSPTNGSVYLDNSLASTATFSVETDYASSSQSYGSDNYSFSLAMKVKNLSNATLSLNIKEFALTRESTSATYQVNCSATSALSIDSEITKTIAFSSSIPTSITGENYFFSVKLNSFSYTVKLYETPDSERKDVTVRYLVDGRIVKSTTVKERRALGEKYVYENPNHLSHCSEWKTSDGTTVSEKTIISESMNLVGSETENLEFFELSSWDDSSVQRVTYVPSDGALVIPSTHGKYTVNSISSFGIYKADSLQTLFLPSTIKTIYYGNFQDCPKLKSINFAGTEDQWKAISISFVFPTDVILRFNTPIPFL